MEKFEALKARLNQVKRLSEAASIVAWDQQTYMPPGGASARAEQLTALSKVIHEMFVDAETGDLLAAAETEVADAAPDSDEAALVRVTRHDYDLQTRLPSALVMDITRTTAEAHEIWAKAREENDFNRFAPSLERIFGLMRQKAEAYGYDDRPYDALLNEYEPRMKTAEVEALFDELRAELVPFVGQIFDNLGAVDDGPVKQNFPIPGQEAFGLDVVKALGFDMERGRQDRSVHPFTDSFSINDVRITTRYQEDWLPSSLFGSMHEAGHGMYEQGVSQSMEGTTLANGTSLGIHESQSRLWENIVGRSRGFWEHFYQPLQATFPDQLNGVSLDAWYQAINAVSHSLVRVEADEVTYNLHIMLRFEMENDLLEGRLAVKDAPDAWNAKMEDYLRVTPPADGTKNILQDVHWSAGLVGYFPTYSLGNFLSVQFWDQALTEEPTIPDQIAQGNFVPLHDWMRRNIYVHGRKLWPQELVERVTGEKMQVRSYMRYITDKYRAIYGLS